MTIRKGFRERPNPCAKLSTGEGDIGVDKEKWDRKDRIVKAKNRAEAKIVDFAEPVRELGVRTKPHIKDLMASSYHVAQRQMSALEAKALEGPLTYEELRQYKILTETLVALSREERAQDAAYDASKKSDEELLRLAEEAKRVLEQGDGE